jgi:hypothetical protein
MGLIHIPPTLPNCPRVARFDLSEGMGVGFGLYYRSRPTAGAAPMSPAGAQGSPEQRAACGDDATQRCQCNLPDVNLITAYHQTQLGLFNGRVAVDAGRPQPFSRRRAAKVSADESRAAERGCRSSAILPEHIKLRARRS